MSDTNEQQWEKVTIKRRVAPAGAAGKIESSVRASQSVGAHLAKVERAADEGALKVKKVSAESKAALVKARMEFARGKLTQEAADAECALPKHTIRDIEAGRLVPDGNMLRKISRGLRVDLKFE
jgi:hypothetical protein